MASAVRRLGAYLGLVEDEYGEEAVAETPVREIRAARSDVRMPERGERPASVRPIRQDAVLDRPVPQPIDHVSRIVTVQPQSFNDAQRAGEAFRNGSPVVVDVTQLDRTQAQRVIDFAAGLVFGLEGRIQRVTEKVFLLSPRNVDVEVDQARQAANSAFFNHS